MKIKYKVIHIEKNSQRNNSVAKTKLIMENRGIHEIGSAVADLENFNKVNAFLQANKNFKFNFHNDFEKPFPHVSGVVGCWASHYLAWEKMIAEGLDILVMFEDDVYIDEDFVDYLNVFINDAPDGWDFISLSLPNGEEDRFSMAANYIGNNSLCKFYQAWNTGCYMISRGGALKALKDINKNGISVPIDWYIFEDGRDKFNTYNPLPHIKKIVMFDDDFSNSYIGTTEEFR